MSTRRLRKKVRLTVKVVQGDSKHYSEFEIYEGEEIRLGLSMTESAPGNYMEGKPISSADAREHVQREEERLRAGQMEQLWRPFVRGNVFEHFSTPQNRPCIWVVVATLS